METLADTLAEAGLALQSVGRAGRGLGSNAHASVR